MNEQERYLFDVQGYLLVPGVLRLSQIEAMNRAIADIKRWGRKYAPDF